MNSSTKKALIGVSIAVTVILILLLTLFIVMYVHQVIERNEEHKKLESCVPLIEEVERLENELNVTQRFLRTPSEYKQLAGKCEEAIRCVSSVNSTVSVDVLHTFRPCQFYVYYNQDFSSCADQLISKKDEGIPCLNTIFNDNNEPDLDKCRQWDGLQDCVKGQISRLCGGETKRYEKKAAYLRSFICGDENAEKV